MNILNEKIVWSFVHFEIGVFSNVTFPRGIQKLGRELNIRTKISPSIIFSQHYPALMTSTIDNDK